MNTDNDNCTGQILTNTHTDILTDYRILANTDTDIRIIWNQYR
jgi:hypothetical protein